MGRRWQQAKQQLRRNRPAQLALAILAVFGVTSALAWLSPWDPNAMAIQARMLPPDSAHWFGTDEYGRDYFTRALYGGQISLMVGVLAMTFSTLIGTLVGTVSGYVGGRLDTLLMRAVDMLMSIPAFFLLLVLNAYLKPGVANIILIISALTWMNLSRLVRAETLSLKEREYVLYARASGERAWRIILRHIIPNILPTIMVAATLNIASAILMESTLSFLGLGVQQPNASWGSMLNNAQAYIGDATWLALFPGMLILLTVLSFNVLGDVFRTAFEPGAQRDE
ncbi:ABC transporter permease [Dickeya fangzhongdai]|uniref:Peptide ABC transporter permease n=1 Tax=Dickeya fangzhongdai TaxID=1778540 RepID=A0A2K8QMC5_9GAMM|nr:ABC transporter permease [Dickeya fangzhongdai]ATZ94168.1 peptide ABC transporter permease [Dickeya fangzhongdai]QOH47603.1 ABC transporter permease [Dickeya fangzhongdai]QOH51909.1 ABC transporter permease [Dickeya fangzhongdai]WOY00894.1 ABC transporter permease [Dickeya fangzhongdai]WOY03954.1 ABC transporter permease [Dickeya fangzhongdai]